MVDEFDAFLGACEGFGVVLGLGEDGAQLEAQFAFKFEFSVALGEVGDGVFGVSGHEAIVF